MIAGVGDVQATLAQGEALRQLEAACRGLSIPIPRGTRTELPQHAAIMAAFEDAMVARVADEQAPIGRQHVRRKCERTRRIGACVFQQVGRRSHMRRRQSILQARDGFFDFRSAAFAHPARGELAIRIDQQRGRPRGNRIQHPCEPIGIVGNRRAQTNTLQRLQNHRVRLLRGVTRRVHAQQHEFVGVFPFQLAELAEEIDAAGAGRIPEHQQHHASAQFRHSQTTLAVHPMQCLGDFGERNAGTVGLERDVTRHHDPCPFRPAG
jgi:hypothetical protein